MAMLRRYAPFALLIATQAVLVLVAPTKGAPSAAGAVGGQFPGAAQQAPAAMPSDNAGAPTGTGSGSTTAAASSGGGSRGTGGGGATPVTPGGASGNSSGPVGAVSAPASGATNAKPFCITGLLEHPPCTRTWAGGDNGGATWQGVTGKTVKVVMYRPKDNAAVEAILRTTGTYISPQAEKDHFELVADWINKHYQLYGRKIEPLYVQGTCEIAPPVDSCFRSEADSINAQYKPFALFWDNNSSEPAFFDELSRKGVVNWGGWHFDDKFNSNLRPYHYDVFTGGGVQADLSGAWYCQRMAGKKARYAGTSDLQALTRKVVVVYPDTPWTTPSAKHLEATLKKCAGAGAVVDGPYSSDTSTSSQQATTNTSKYKGEGVTSILWFSDPIAPTYGTKAAASQSWYPENILAGSGLLDYDSLAQTYDQTEWQNAFGPSDLGQSTSVDQKDAGRIWRAEGRSGNPDVNSDLLTAYETTIGGGIMAAGPKLTPLTFEYGMLTTPGYDAWDSWHDQKIVYVKYGRDDYTGISDIREVYWSNTATSPVNGKPGTYVALNGGRRYQLNQIPAGEFTLPSSR